MPITRLGILFLVPFFLLVSCLHSPLRAYLDESVGRMTYAEAVEKWGEPNTLKAGENMINATWSDFESGSYYMGQDVFGPDGSMPTTHGWRLSLNFEEETKLLKSWKHHQW